MSTPLSIVYVITKTDRLEFVNARAYEDPFGSIAVARWYGGEAYQPIARFDRSDVRSWWHREQGPVVNFSHCRRSVR
jgi:hypothetical protein